MFKKTKEKINQNEYIVFVKNVWNNKRYRSLFILVLYFIFFFVVITALRSTYQDNSTNNGESNNNSFSFEGVKEEYNNLSDYSYEIFVNEELLINGRLESGINNFIYDNEQYTIINNNIYKEDDEDLKRIDLTKEDMLISTVDKLMLSNLIDYVSSLNQKGVINEDSFSLEFEIPNSYFGLDGEETANVNISGKTKTKIDELTVDLTDYKKETYIITVKVGDNNDGNIR